MPRFYVCAAAIVGMALTLTMHAQAQAVQSLESPLGQVVGSPGTELEFAL